MFNENLIALNHCSIFSIFKFAMEKMLFFIIVSIKQVHIISGHNWVQNFLCIFSLLRDKSCPRIELPLNLISTGLCKVPKHIY